MSPDKFEIDFQKRKLIVGGVVLAAGQGTRMKSHLPKSLHPIGSKPMVRHIIDTLEAAGIEKIVVVKSEASSQVDSVVAPHTTVVQREQLGTGHAASMARRELEGIADQVIIVYCDMPFISVETVKRLLDRLQDTRAPAVVVAGFRSKDWRYGRLILSSDGSLSRIVELRDANEKERESDFCNGGLFAVDGRALWSLLASLSNENSQREYYLTDVVTVARQRGLLCLSVEVPAEEMFGINSQEELATAQSRVLVDRLEKQGFLLQTAITIEKGADRGKLIGAVTLPWFEIVHQLERNPSFAFQIPAERWEEIIAGAYKRAGFDEVILTPRSGDLGRDVIAVKRGLGRVRVIDQIKAYRPNHLVNANDVRALVGVLQTDGAAKGFLTTTSSFAPRLYTDPLIKPLIPSRLELIGGNDLLQRLSELARE